MKIGVIGLGLIGGSMAIDLRRRGFASRLLGVDADPVNASAAEKMGLVDRVVSLDECVDDSDLVIVSVPVGAALKLVPTILDRFELTGAKEKIVIDVCSTKEQLARSVKYHPCRRQYVASHPMSGTEYSGPWAAKPGLFDGRAGIICDQEESAPKAVRTVERLYDTLNMRLIYMNSSSHDVHTAYVSHVSHVTSFALALTVLEKEKDEKHICPLQLDTIKRAVCLWSNEGDVVLTPFMGIGSEVYQSILCGRKGIGFELKESYFNEAVKNIKEAEFEVNQDSLF